MAAAASTTEQLTTLVAQLGGLAILAGTLAAAAAVVYRWYVREAVPRALSLLVGLSGVALYLNTTTALGQVIAGSSAPTDAERALFNITAFAVAAGGATLGRRAGDQFGTDVVLGEGLTDVDSEVGKLVQSVGRVVTVQLPDDIEDVTGYDPVPEATKEKLAGRTFLFPRRLTVAQLRERLTQRLKTDYAVGHVDVELAEDGSVEYLAVGSRAAGIGPTLPPATNAVAIRADPAFAASAGDLVQVWETDPMRRVLTAELRGVADETVTIAIDAADTPKLNPTKEYRLVTLPVTDRPDREFASLLRAAEETFSSVTVEAGSPLHGLPVGALSLTVISVKPENEEPAALPEPSTILAPGDMVFAVGRPDALRRLETAAEPLDPSLVRRPVPSKHPRDQPRQTEPAAPAEPEDAAASSQPAPDTRQEPAQSPETGPTPEPADATGPAEEGVVDGPGGDGAAGEGPAPAAADETAPPAAGGDGDTATTATAEADADNSNTAGKAGPESFQELKEEFESGQADWDDDESPEPADGDADIDAGSDTAKASGDQGTSPATDDDPDETTTDSGTSGKAGPGSFQELKDEFESGEADWDDDEATGDDGEDTEDDESEAGDDAEVAFENDAAVDAGFEDDDSLDDLDVGGDETDGDLDGLEFEDDTSESGGEDDVDGLLEDDEDDAFEDDGDDGLEDDEDGLGSESADDALGDISFEDDGGDDGLDDLSFDEDDGDDDLAALGGEDDEDDGLSLDEDDEGDEADTDEEEEADDDDDDDDDDDGGGGGTSFAQLKEEFESGDADWEDDISDSPGGDMRLDE